MIFMQFLKTNFRTFHPMKLIKWSIFCLFDAESQLLINTVCIWVGLGCRFKVNCPLVGFGPVGRMPSVGVFQRDSSLYLLEFWRKHGKLGTARLISATGDRTWHLSSTSFEHRTAPPLVGTQIYEYRRRRNSVQAFKYYCNFRKWSTINFAFNLLST